MISAIIPVVDRPRTLQRAARSVVEQAGIDPSELELIVVDDGSEPPIAPPMLPPGSRIVRLDRNQGPAAARNAGVAAARGELIAFLDSDDVWLPGKLASQLAYFGQASHGSDAAATAVVCGFYYYKHRSRQFEARVPRASSDPVDFAGGCWFCPGSTLFLSRRAFERTGGFDERLRRLEDVDWFLRFALQNGTIRVAPHMGAIIRPSGSVGRTGLDPPLGLLEKKFLRSEAPLRLEGAMRRTFLAYSDLERCASELVDGHTLSALLYLGRSLLLSPRPRPALRPYWSDDGEVPPEVLRIAAGTSGSAG